MSNQSTLLMHLLAAILIGSRDEKREALNPVDLMKKLFSVETLMGVCISFTNSRKQYSSTLWHMVIYLVLVAANIAKISSLLKTRFFIALRITFNYLI